MKKDNDELNAILNKRTKKNKKSLQPDIEAKAMEKASKPIQEKIGHSLIQWTTSDHHIYIPASFSSKKLMPGLYEIHECHDTGVYFEKIELNTEDIIELPEVNSLKVIKEIETFWNREKKFQNFDLTFKRGILLWGPPGGGKTCLIKLIIKNLINREGVVIKFDNPRLFLDGMRKFREIERATPCVVIMEDLDDILDQWSEAKIVNILDGVDLIDKVVFVATTNYPERLGAKIVNRPSRFDKRIKIGKPNPKSRLVYFKHLFSKSKSSIIEYNLKQWVEDTENMSMAHLKELFVSVIILGDDYDDTIEILKSMRDKISPQGEEHIGF